MKQAELSAAWKVATGDSWIVDIRAIPDSTHVIRYVTKYVGKPTDPALYSKPNQLEEFILACRGVRFCSTFGSWRGVKLERQEKTDKEWKTLGLLEQIIDRARGGCEKSLEMLVALRRKYFWLPTAKQLKENTS